MDEVNIGHVSIQGYRTTRIDKIFLVFHANLAFLR